MRILWNPQHRIHSNNNGYGFGTLPDKNTHLNVRIRNEMSRSIPVLYSQCFIEAKYEEYKRSKRPKYDFVKNEYCSLKDCSLDFSDCTFVCSVQSEKCWLKKGMMLFGLITNGRVEIFGTWYSNPAMTLHSSFDFYWWISRTKSVEFQKIFRPQF